MRKKTATKTPKFGLSNGEMDQLVALVRRGTVTQLTAVAELITARLPRLGRLAGYQRMTQLITDYLHTTTDQRKVAELVHLLAAAKRLEHSDAVQYDCAEVKRC